VQSHIPLAQLSLNELVGNGGKPREALYFQRAAETDALLADGRTIPVLRLVKSVVETDKVSVTGPTFDAFFVESTLLPYAPDSSASTFHNKVVQSQDISLD
jgi:hypothetical protein